MTRRLRVLVSAFACEPGEGSEPGAGWEWSIAAAENHDVWLLTRSNNLDAVRAALAERPELACTVVGYDLPAPWPRVKKRVPGGTHLYYVAWQIAVARVARRLHDEVRFDVLHHITWSTDWLPAGVARIDDVPFVWGPIGGATRTPWRHWRWFGARGVAAEAARAVMIPAMRRLTARRNFARASLVLAQNPDELRLVPPGVSVVVEPHIALRSTDADDPPPRAGRRVAVFAGRALYWKGLRVAVATMAQPDAAGWELHVYGDGPDLGPARKLARALGVEERVHFYGKVERRRVLASIAGADALLFPSFHDAAGWIVAEAVAADCPVVCLDVGGPPVIAGDDGLTVSTHTADLPGAFARRLRELPTTRRHGALTPRWPSSRLALVMRNCYEQAGARIDGG
jgi:glycosyltransferase involved in cell wall biosynthesis